VPLSTATVLTVPSPRQTPTFILRWEPADSCGGQLEKAQWGGRARHTDIGDGQHMDVMRPFRARGVVWTQNRGSTPGGTKGHSMKGKLEE